MYTKQEIIISSYWRYAFIYNRQDTLAFMEAHTRFFEKIGKHSTNTPLSYTKPNVFYKFGQFSTFGLKANYWI